MRYIIVEVEGTISNSINSVKNGELIGVYDNLMLLSLHIHKKYYYRDTNAMINKRERVRDSLINKGYFACDMYVSYSKSLIVVNPEHKDMDKHEYNFIKAYLRNINIDKLLL